jgi:ribA/ribD-fused uncharacterized protein
MGASAHADRAGGPADPSRSVLAEGAHPLRVECHGLDTPERVCFYEQDFYVLSNFSSFTLRWKGHRFDTSEAAYHWEKFCFVGRDGEDALRETVCEMIRTAPSAHEAFKTANTFKHIRRPDWDSIKKAVMLDILRAKAAQHEYVWRKLLATGDRELVENSWRDDVWGWGPNHDGQNLLGKLWMHVRAELRDSDGSRDGRDAVERPDPKDDSADPERVSP